MATSWLQALGKDKRGSRPRCILLVDASRNAVAAQLTDLVGLDNVMVSPNHFWMPRGKPVRMGRAWDKKPADEARLDRDDRFVGPRCSEQAWLGPVASCIALR